MTTEKLKAGLNFTSVMLVVITGLSAWTLKTVFDLAVAASADHSQLQQHERAINQLDTRVSDLEYDNRGRPRAHYNPTNSTPTSP